MSEYNFVLQFALSSDDRDYDDLIERLGDAGCTDALVSIGCTGTIALDFGREAESAEAAVVSAYRSVRKVIPSAKLIHVSPDLVGFSEIAEHIGVTRQNVRKVYTNNENFPTPVYSGKVSLWHFSDVLTWMNNHGGYHTSELLVETTKVARRFNIENEKIKHPAQDCLTQLFEEL